MREENAIEVRDITKSFKVYMDRSNNVKDFLIHKNRRRNEVRDVLKGISFDVKKGEAVGLIGRNGCGKSTTLKLLTRIMYPDSGSIEMRGRVTSLIELGAGFHPDMSGRENIYINASIFGLSKSEIDARVQDIIDFSELADYIDNPVRTYSSGMYMRLAFAVAINVDADILLIDEILAVGDIAFQEKCFRKLKDLRKEGITIVLVSHSLGQVESICDTSIWIEQGHIKMKGRPKDVHAYYLATMNAYRDDEDDEEIDPGIEKKSDMQRDYISRLRDDLEKACVYLDEIGKADLLPEAITQSRVDREGTTRAQVEEAFEKLNPDKLKKYLFYGCIGHSDMIGRLRKKGYQVYGYEPYVLDVFIPYVICGKRNLEDMRFDDVFEVGYLKNAVNSEEERDFMESLKKKPGENAKINMLPRLTLKNGETVGDRDAEINHGELVYGPYCTLYDGAFRVYYEVTTKDGKTPESAKIRITANYGADVLAEEEITDKKDVINFTTDKVCENVEFLVEAGDYEDIIVKKIELEIVNAI